MTNNPRANVPRCQNVQRSAAYPGRAEPQVRTVTQYDFAAMPLAMAYVPPQSWGEIYPNDRALERGTLFPALDLPFKCERGCSR